MGKRLASRKSGAERAPSAARVRRALDRFEALAAFDARIVAALVGQGGVCRLAGVDEAGRGALAGPVVAAAVVLHPGVSLPDVDDSKRLSEKRRESIFDDVIAASAAVSIACGQPALIDRENILRATLMKMRHAVLRLGVVPDLVLVDGRDGFECDSPVRPLVGGDACSLCIAAASIVAKVARDRIMRRLHLRYPGYNFAGNKGYGTREHVDAIRRRGMAAVHRRTFRPKAVEKPLRMF